MGGSIRAKRVFFVRIMSIVERSEHVLIPNHIVMIAVQSKVAYSDSVSQTKTAESAKN